MIMRWMKLEGTTFCTPLLFLLFILNKIKINIFLSVIWLSVQYKNTPKIKVLQMPWNLNMFFSRIFENIWHWEHSRGVNHLPTRVEGAPYPPGAPPASWAHGGPPPLIPAPTHFIFLPQTRISSSSTSSSSLCCHFRSSFSKHLSQNCLGRLFLGMRLLHWSN